MGAARTAPAITTAPDGAQTDARRWLTLALVLCGSFMTLFDLFVINVAIPTMQRDLRASFAQIQFVIAGYALAYATTLVTGGRLGDIFGRKRLFLLGMAGFTLTSALCGLAPAPTFLIAARILQGLAAAAMTPQVLAIIQVTFPPADRGRALGIYGAVLGVGGIAGQVLGGLLIRADLFGLSWRPVFLVNVPIGVGALVAARFLLAESRAANAPRLDPGGVAILTVGLFLLAFPLVEGRDAGWPVWAWLCLVAALPALACFVAYERRVQARGGSPLVALRLFRVRSFVAGLWAILLFNGSSSSFFFALALYLQIGLHFSALAAGLTLGPGGLGFFLGATFGVRLIGRLGSRLVLCGYALTGVTMTAAAVVVAVAPESPPLPLLAALFLIQGIGAGSAAPAMIGFVLAEIARDDAGAASGVLVTCQQIGSALGVAVIGVVLFGTLAVHAPTVSGELAPAFAAQLAGATADTATTVADARICAEDRARSHDPAIPPARCQRPTLQPADPAASAAVAQFLQRANARSYATAYITSSIASILFVVGAIASVLVSTAVRRGTHP